MNKDLLIKLKRNKDEKALYFLFYINYFLRISPFTKIVNGFDFIKIVQPDQGTTDFLVARSKVWNDDYRGVYSIPAGVWKGRSHPGSYSEWITFDEKIPVKKYARLAADFNPTKFDARSWVSIAKSAGMKYVVLTTKHHEGFSMFKSDLTEFDIKDATPFKRDITKELADACREAGLRFGCYYSVDRDWDRPHGPGNEYKQTNTWDFPDSKNADFDEYFYNFEKPQIEELLINYRPDIFWFDGIGMKSDQQVQELVQLIRKLAPGCLINSRIKTCKIPSSDPSSYCDYITVGDNEIPTNPLGFDWETAATMNQTYAYSRVDTNWMGADEVIFWLADTVSKGGNYLLNVGPTSEGLFPQADIDRLLEVRKWIKINGEAIYGTTPWRVYGEGPALKKRLSKIKLRRHGFQIEILTGVRWTLDSLPRRTQYMLYVLAGQKVVS
jgi:alpha-L-fucosidase